MPNLIGRRHNEIMERFFKTGKNKIFNKERYLFGQHKDGYCFHIKILVRPMPHLETGFIQYVGLVISAQDENEYILTDLCGVISSMSSRLAEVLCIEQNWIHQGVGLNVQLFAPDLIPYYAENENNQQRKTKKYSDPGGEELLIVVPKDLSKCIKENSGHLTCKKNKDKKISSECVNYLAKYNNMLNKKRRGSSKDGDISPTKLFQQEEYKKSQLKIKTKCQIKDMSFAVGKCKIYKNKIIANELLKMRVIKILGLRLGKGLAKKLDDELSITIQDIHKDESFCSYFDAEEKKVINRDAMISDIIQKIGQGNNDHDDSNSSSGSKDATNKSNEAVNKVAKEQKNEIPASSRNCGRKENKPGTS